MRARGLGVFVALVVAVAAVVWWPRPMGPGRQQEAIQRSIPRFEGIAPPQPEASRVDSDEPRQVQLDALAADCGLDAELQCTAAGCAALLRMPDLDQLGGWLQIAGLQPRFVMSTVARDLGLRRGLLPCVAAAGGLGPVRTVDHPEGGELWCAGPPEACDAASQAAHGVGGFTEPRVRQLAF